MAIAERSNVRRGVVWMLAAFSLLGYVLRMNISIAQQSMAPELGLSDVQTGQLFSAFMLAYAIFQIPAGIWGDRRGPRFVLTVAALCWCAATALTGLIPGLIATGTAAFLSILACRFLLGAAEAATYPVAARAIANWIPGAERVFSNSLIFAGATAGAAFTPPLIAWVMQRYGWRSAFYVTAILPVALAVVWWRKVRDTPEADPSVSPSELATIVKGRPAGYAGAAVPAWRTLLHNRNIALLCLSYFFDSYVVFIFLFWLFKYLVDVRNFSIAGSGWATSLPYITASIAVPLLGRFSDRLSIRLGLLPSRRAVAMACLIFSGLLLFAGARAAEPWIAVASISLSVGFLMSTEGPYWSTAIELAGSHAGAAGGLLNMAGNFGGVVSTSLMPVLVQKVGWEGALASGSLCALTASALWLLLNPTGERNSLKTGSPIVQPAENVRLP